MTSVHSHEAYRRATDGLPSALAWLEHKASRTTSAVLPIEADAASAY